MKKLSEKTVTRIIVSVLVLLCMVTAYGTFNRYQKGVADSKATFADSNVAPQQATTQTYESAVVPKTDPSQLVPTDKLIADIKERDKLSEGRSIPLDSPGTGDLNIPPAASKPQKDTKGPLPKAPDTNPQATPKQQIVKIETTKPLVPPTPPTVTTTPPKSTPGTNQPPGNNKPSGNGKMGDRKTVNGVEYVYVDGFGWTPSTGGTGETIPDAGGDWDKQVGTFN